MDGFHRKGEDPNWKEQVLADIDTPLKLAYARLIVNTNRRDVGSEEKKQRLRDIYVAHQEECGEYPKASDVAKALGRGVEWVYEYLDTRFKNLQRVNAAKKGGRPPKAGLPPTTQTQEHTAEDPEEVVVERKPPLQDVQTDETTPTPEETVEELVALRDEGLISGQQEPLARSTWNRLPEALRTGRLLYAIFIHRKPLTECLDVLAGRPTTPNPNVSPRLSESRRPTYTKSEITFSGLLARAGVTDYVTNEPLTYEEDGEEKAYVPDVWFREKKLVVEIEGAGSASADNPKRDGFLKSQGYVVIHITNDAVKKEPERVLRLFLEEYIPRGLICAKCGTTYR